MELRQLNFDLEEKVKEQDARLEEYERNQDMLLQLGKCRSVQQLQ